MPASVALGQGRQRYSLEIAYGIAPMKFMSVICDENITNNKPEVAKPLLCAAAVTLSIVVDSFTSTTMTGHTTHDNRLVTV